MTMWEENLHVGSKLETINFLGVALYISYSKAILLWFMDYLPSQTDLVDW